MTAHTVVQIGKSKSNEEFQARWQKIADQSLKQCGRVSRLLIQLPIALTERLAQKSVGTRLWCDEQQWAHAPFLGDQLQSERFEGITLLIGPEGGWTDDERKVIRQSATAVSLGPLILRAETAAVFATSASHLALRRQET
jgi:16S rRNA (uracil1498-N3)-methyltransferase